MSNSLSPEVQRRLKEDFLPHLDELLIGRNKTQKLMSLIIMVPCALLIVWLIKGMIFDNEFYVVTFSTLLPLIAISFVYLGKLQSCNDQIFSIKLSVIAGTDEVLRKSFGKSLTCMGNFEGLIKEMKGIVKDGK